MRPHTNEFDVNAHLLNASFDFTAASLSTSIAADVPDGVAVLLRDAQTSGGLLLATPSPETLLAELERRDTLAAVIGQVASGAGGHIEVRP